MKKIVAIVLAMVMVLGLATTAFAATTAYAEWDATVEATKDMADATATGVALPTITKAVAPTKTNLSGAIAYYDYNNAIYVKGTAADCDIYFTVEGKTAPVMYLKEIDTPAYEAVAKEFTNFGKSCGQVDIDVVPDTKYYSYVTLAGDTIVYAGSETATVFVLVNGELVGVDATDLYAANVVDHVWTFAYDAKNNPVSAKCEICAANAAVYDKYTAIPAGADYITEGALFLVVGGAAAAGDATVESAKTFDAGIAMYVGMSVMAAAGSAVVLKKKD